MNSNIESNLAKIGGVFILITMALFMYSVYLRFTTQHEYFTWLWNASPEVQYITGWALFTSMVGVAFIYLSNTLAVKK